MCIDQSLTLFVNEQFSAWKKIQIQLHIKKNSFQVSFIVKDNIVMTR